MAAASGMQMLSTRLFEERRPGTSRMNGRIRNVTGVGGPCGDTLQEVVREVRISSEPVTGGHLGNCVGARDGACFCCLEPGSVEGAAEVASECRVELIVCVVCTVILFLRLLRESR